MREHRDFCWPYDDATQWMARSAAELLAGGSPVIGVGSHSRDLVTLGRNAFETDADATLLRQKAVDLYRVSRGGGATVHGPGQLVVYPVVDLGALGLSIPAFTSVLSEAMIAALKELGIEAIADVHGPGVYVDGAKIGSIGFRVERGIVTHGLALNVDNRLDVFALIKVCGREAAKVTSVVRELREPGKTGHAKLDEVADLVVHQLLSRCVLG